VQEGEEAFLFYTTDKRHFYQVPIKIQKREGDLVAFEPLKPIPQAAFIVEKGALYLQASTQEEE
jgi:hypothetical protein